MIATSFQLVDAMPRWGLVTVFENGAIAREYSITADELVDVMAGGKPPRCTEAEWTEGRTVVAGRPCFKGMGVENSDGSLVVNYGIEEVGGRVHVSLMQIPPHEWRLEDGVVLIAEDVVRAMRWQ